MSSYSVEEAAAMLEELLDRVELGEEIIITRDGKPCAKIVRWTEPAGPADSE